MTSFITKENALVENKIAINGKIATSTKFIVLENKYVKQLTIR